MTYLVHSILMETYRNSREVSFSFCYKADNYNIWNEQLQMCIYNHYYYYRKSNVSEKHIPFQILMKDFQLTNND